MPLRGAFDCCCGPQVELTPAAVGEAFVGHVAEHRMTKPDAVRAVPLEDRVEVGAESVVENDPVGSHKIGQDSRAKAATEDGRGAHEAAGHRRESVELDGHCPVERLGQHAGEAGRPTDSEQLAQKERAPAHAFDDGVDLMGPKWCGLGRDMGERATLRLAHRGEVEDRAAARSEAAGSSRRVTSTSHGRSSAEATR